LQDVFVNYFIKYFTKIKLNEKNIRNRLKLQINCAILYITIFIKGIKIMEKKKYLECGKIVNTHGVKGAVKLESWCNTPHDLAELERIFISQPGGMKEYHVKHASVFKQFVIAELDGINDFDTAFALKNKTAYASRDDFLLEDGDYFIADLIGLPVIDVNTKAVYGKLKEIINRGASDIYVIDTDSGEKMMPAVDEFVKEIDVNKGIFVAPIEGMLD